MCYDSVFYQKEDLGKSSGELMKLKVLLLILSIVIFIFGCSPQETHTEMDIAPIDPKVENQEGAWNDSLQGFAQGLVNAEVDEQGLPAGFEAVISELGAMVYTTYCLEYTGCINRQFRIELSWDYIRSAGEYGQTRAASDLRNVVATSFHSDNVVVFNMQNQHFIDDLRNVTEERNAEKWYLTLAQITQILLEEQFHLDVKENQQVTLIQRDGLGNQIGTQTVTVTGFGYYQNGRWVAAFEEGFATCFAQQYAKSQGLSTIQQNLSTQKGQWSAAACRTISDFSARGSDDPWIHFIGLHREGSIDLLVP